MIQIQPLIKTDHVPSHEYNLILFENCQVHGFVLTIIDKIVNESLLKKELQIKALNDFSSSITYTEPRQEH